MASGKKASAKKAAPKSNSSGATAKVAPKSNEQHPEPAREAVPTYRADMGEGLPDQADALNPDRAK